MAADDGAAVRATLEAAIAAHERMRDADLSAAGRVARVIQAAHEAGRQVLVFGNGGSAGDAQHFATELICRYVRDRRAVAALALSADASVMTAIGNDYGFERVFVRQIEGLGRPGDVAIGISTSGASANVVEGLRAARRRGLVTVALTGRDGGEAGRSCDIHVNVPDEATARVQEVHRTLIHAICELVEQDL